jgi:hypothetical protein
MQVYKLEDILRQQEAICIEMQNKIIDVERADRAKKMALQERKASNIRSMRICAGIILTLSMALWWRW